MSQHPNSPQEKALLETMTWPEARRAAQNGGRVVLLPVGAIEQHGPHLPVDVDNRIVVWLCDEAAKRRPDLIMSVPPIHYGFNEHNMGFPGTVTFNTFEGASTVVGVRLDVLDVLVNAQVPSSLATGMVPGQRVSVAVDGTRAVCELPAEAAQAAALLEIEEVEVALARAPRLYPASVSNRSTACTPAAG